MTYRIIELIHNAGHADRKHEFIIQQRGFFNIWTELFSSDGVNHKRNSFSTYEKAEEYIYEKFCGHGLCKRISNVYKYTSYSYSY